MRTLLTACLLIGAFFLGAYVDRTTAAPGWPTAETVASYAAVPMPPRPEIVPHPEVTPAVAAPADPRLQPRPGMSIRASKDCLPTLLRRGMSYTESSHVCGLIVSGLARNSRS